MENEPCRWSSGYKDNLIGGSLWGLNGRPLVNTLWHRLLSLSLSAWKSRASLKLGATPKKSLQPKSRPSLKIEPTSHQISEETLESLKLRERNFKHQTTPEQPVKPTEGHPQEWLHATTRGVSSQETKRQISDHFNLKASTKQNLYSAESWGIYLESKIKRVLHLMIDTGKMSCRNCRTVLDCNHSQLNSLLVRVVVCMYFVLCCLA